MGWVQVKRAKNKNAIDELYRDLMRFIETDPIFVTIHAFTKYDMYSVILKFWKFQCQQVLPDIGWNRPAVQLKLAKKFFKRTKNHAAISAEIILINVWQLVV